MPIGILGSLAICTVLYILVAGVLTALVNYRYLNVPDPLAIGIDSTGVRWGSLLVKLGALMGLTSTIVVMLLGQSRVFFSMSRDRLLPALFSAVHPPFRTPLVPLVPILGILISLAMMLSLTPVTWIRLAVWLIIGMVIYFSYSRHHSRVQRDGAA